MSQEQLEVMEELEMEIEHSTGEEREEYERTLKVCREFSYALAEGMISVEECAEELHFFPAA